MVWEYLTKLPDGHRLFETYIQGESRVAIADDSGRNPEHTDDGVLWLDQTRCLTVDSDESFSPPREVFFIPLRTENGEKHVAGTNASTILHLANWLKWQVEDVNNKAIYEIR